MRSFNVLLLVVLVTISFSSAFEFINLAEVKELRSSSYGNSLIETISLSLQNNGSINEVEKLLNDLLFKLNKDQEDADKEWEKTDRRLRDKITQLVKEIEDLEKQIAVDEAEKKAFETKRDQAVRNLEQYRHQREQNNNALEANEKNRKNDKDEYAKSVTEHNDVINAIESVVKELRKLEGSVSGKGRPVHVEEIEAEKRDREHAAKQLQHSFVQITRDEEEARIFVELATTADQVALHKLIDLLEKLRDSTKASLNDDEEHEKNSERTYENLKTTLNNDNVKLDKNISEQVENHKKYVSEVERLTNKLDEERKLKASKEKERDDTKKEHQDKEAQYKADKAERDNERKVIQRLQKIVQERLANMSKFLRGKTGAF